MNRFKTAPRTVLIYPICGIGRKAAVVPNPQPTSSPTEPSPHPPTQRRSRPPNVAPAHPTSSRRSHRHPGAAIVIPAQPSSSPRSHRHLGAAIFIPAQPSSSRRSHRHPGAAIVISAQPSSSRRSHLHPGAAIVIPAHAGTQKSGQTGGAAYRASFPRTRAPKRTQRPSSRAVPTTQAHQDRYRVPTSSYAIRVQRTARSTRESQTTPFPVPFVKRAGSVEAAGFIPAQIGTILAEGARTHQTTNTPHSQSFQSRQSEFGQINVLKPVFCHTRVKANNNSGAHHAIRSDI